MSRNVQLSAAVAVFASLDTLVFVNRNLLDHLFDEERGSHHDDHEQADYNLLASFHLQALENK